MTNFDNMYNYVLTSEKRINEYAKKSQDNIASLSAQMEQFKKASAAFQSGDRDAALAMLKKLNGGK